MKKKGFIFGLIFAFCLIAIVVGIYIVPTLQEKMEADESYRSIKIESLEGEAVVKRSDKNLNVYLDMNLRSGDSLETKANSSVVVKLDEDKYIYVGENSKIDLISSEKNSEKTIIRVNEGSIVTEVKNKLKTNETFDVETPNSTMAIRGTTFKVAVTINNNSYDINYSLIEGKITLSVIEKTDDGYQASVFDIKPMEVFNLAVGEDSVIKDNELNDVIEKLGSEDNTVVVKEYEKVDEYTSVDENVQVTKDELTESDIAGDLEVLKNNTDKDTVRIVAKLATFDVYKNDAKVEENLYKYESKDEYTISAYAIPKEGYHVIGWMIDGENAVNGSSLKFKVTKSCSIEPIYEEDGETQNEEPDPNEGGDNPVVVPATEYDLKVIKAYTGGNVETQTIHTAHASVEYKPNSKELFMGWYLLGEDDKTLITTDYKLELDVTEDTTVFAEIVVLKDIPYVLELLKEDEAIEYLSLALDEEINLFDFTFKLINYETKDEYVIDEELLQGDRTPVNYFICDTADYESVSDFNPLAFKTVDKVDTSKKGVYIVVYYVGDYYFSSIMNEIYDYLIVFVDYTEDEIAVYDGAREEIINQENE